jgi:hypothetical protein
VFTATPELDYRLVKGSGIHAELPSFEAADANIPGGCEYMQKLLLCKTVEYFDPKRHIISEGLGVWLSWS